MIPRYHCFGFVLALSGCFSQNTTAQESTPPFSAAEREAVYTASIERRAADILQTLALTDAGKSNNVRGALIAQYRTLRARDEAMDTMLRALSRDVPGAQTNRAEILPILSRQLHRQFIVRLSADLTPEQVETVKDKMTYNKVKVTYDAYCEIVPGLGEEEKSRIQALLKDAREEAMDGGSADEKSAIFQKYKDQVNAYLNSRGHDVAKAIKAWDARQGQAAAQSPNESDRRP
jgi:hypothetical protein